MPDPGPAQFKVAHRLAPFGATIFAEMTRLAIEHEAVNLSQGFPDFDGPDFVKDAAAEAMKRGHNQYAPPHGVPELRSAIAAFWKKHAKRDADPDREITVTAGCTEAIAAALLGIVNPGDEVVLFEPYYDSYRACVSMAGATPKFVTLHPPRENAAAGEPFRFDSYELRSAFTNKTKAVLLNTPHNPTGKVFGPDELETIADLCKEFNAVVITDEVYERLVFEPTEPHVRIATLPDMWRRTLTLSSLGKTFSLTGWKIGWAVGPPDLTAALRAAHQFLTFAVATPLQHGAAAAINDGEPYVRQLVNDLRTARDHLCGALNRIGLRAFWPAGTYFVMADHSPLDLGDDVEFCRHLIERIGVAAIPPTAFYANKQHGKHLVRFAFCKKPETMEEAVRRLEKLRDQ